MVALSASRKMAAHALDSCHLGSVICAKVLGGGVDNGAHERKRHLESGKDGQVHQIGVHVMQGIFPKLVAPAAVVCLASGAGNRPGDFVENGDDIDRQAAAFLRAAGLPFEEIEPPFAVAIDDDKVIAAPSLGGPLLPLAAFLLFGASTKPPKPAAR